LYVTVLILILALLAAWIARELNRIDDARQREAANLVESERREHSRRMELEALMEVVPAVVWIAHDPECKRITGNRTGQEMLQVGPGANLSRTAPEGERPQNFRVYKNGKPLPDSELAMQVAGREGRPVLGQELELRFSDASSRWIYGNVVPLLNDDRNVRGVVAAFVDITTLKQAQEELRLSRENLRGLAARLQQVREEERTRVAREIHDVLAQELTRLKVDTVWLTRHVNPVVATDDSGPVQDRLGGMAGLIDKAIESVQKIATELRPVVLDTLGLCAAIEWQASEFEARTGIKCEVNLPGDELVIEREPSTALFRILQESLTNVVRHARATQVEIDLHSDENETTLTVRDNGQGICQAEANNPHSLGLLGMRERATLLGGECHISGQPGRGTEVEARLPCANIKTGEAAR
jgi:signal transduction histidine kinase